MLDQILQHKRQELDTLELPPYENVERRSLYEALKNSHFPVGLIAEIKKASPSKGVIQENFRPVETATFYERAGASAISVLTDQRFFQGHRQYISDVKKHVRLPILRKDFIIEEEQVEESARIGADAILLIGEALEASKLHELYNSAREKGMEALVEVHSEEVLANILKHFEPVIVGVNNRDLTTFETSLDQTERMASYIPDNSLLVSESGIFTREDILRVKRAGAEAVLIGEALMRHENPMEQIDIMMRSEAHERANG
ncbi:indole-3-glycerol phosphate synthase TrpC [Pontibacillus yanchengensis]|uniref:indole-3-glycerol-phosphate synthase n=1 Tax=Pontibacillus yanchengensis Y32 TaxID=1385514 RepID=A0A0A2TWN9_9BACI|nr:indole-3-glycerol phosphate synthase TrpC [Pontibacillus yanchengensis]KGP73690.1 indole-3-glycerol phosphate synthase [Pontibacillus yanchengensis Y32]